MGLEDSFEAPSDEAIPEEREVLQFGSLREISQRVITPEASR
jgi:hypothetical protein